MRLIDQRLTRRCRIELIGGAVVALRYSAQHATADIDALREGPGFWKAYEEARAISSAPILIQHAGIADPPLNYEDRLQRPDLGLEKLVVLVPEAHDLVMMKTVRCYENDLQAIEDIHRHHRLDFRTLLERYEETYVQVIGGPEKLRFNLLVVVARLWGEDVAKKLDGSLRPLPSR